MGTGNIVVMAMMVDAPLCVARHLSAAVLVVIAE